MMQTHFDNISDSEIKAEIAKLKGVAPVGSRVNPGEPSIWKIACYAVDMSYWRSWLGPSVTFYDESGLNFDGHHRVRACKFLARTLGLQIHIPVRYDPVMREKQPPAEAAAQEVTADVAAKTDDDYRAPCSPDCCCPECVPTCGDSLCV